MKRQILLLLLLAGMGAFFATGCCYPTRVAVVKKTPVLAPTGPVVAQKAVVLPPTGPILVKEYMVPARPAEVVVVTTKVQTEPVQSGWFFTGIRWVWLP